MGESFLHEPCQADFKGVQHLPLYGKLLPNHAGGISAADWVESRQEGVDPFGHGAGEEWAWESVRTR